MRISFLALLFSVAATMSLASEITPLPDKVPCLVADRQDMQVPDRVHLSGMLGTRIDNSALNRLRHMDIDRLLEGYRKRPGRQSYDGEHVGKWLHAATLAWVYTGNAQLRAKLDHAVRRTDQLPTRRRLPRHLFAQDAIGLSGTFGRTSTISSDC